MRLCSYWTRFVKGFFKREFPPKKFQFFPPPTQTNITTINLQVQPAITATTVPVSKIIAVPVASIATTQATVTVTELIGTTAASFAVPATVAATKFPEALTTQQVLVVQSNVVPLTPASDISGRHFEEERSSTTRLVGITFVTTTTLAPTTLAPTTELTTIPVSQSKRQTNTQTDRQTLKLTDGHSQTNKEAGDRRSDRRRTEGQAGSQKDR